MYTVAYVFKRVRACRSKRFSTINVMCTGP